MESCLLIVILPADKCELFSVIETMSVDNFEEKKEKYIRLAVRVR